MGTLGDPMCYPPSGVDACLGRHSKAGTILAPLGCLSRSLIGLGDGDQSARIRKNEVDVEEGSRGK